VAGRDVAVIDLSVSLVLAGVERHRFGRGNKAIPQVPSARDPRFDHPKAKFLLGQWSFIGIMSLEMSWHPSNRPAALESDRIALKYSGKGRRNE